MNKKVRTILCTLGVFSLTFGHICHANDAKSFAIIGGADGPTSIFLAGKIGNNTSDTSETSQTSEYSEECPFQVTANNFELKQDTVEKVTHLSYTVEINNMTDFAYKDVWFTIAPKKILSPYVTEYESDKKDITSREKAEEHAKDNTDTPAGGFDVTNETLLPLEDKLKKEHQITLEDIKDAMSEITVTIHWTGGSQEEKLKF
ncbi:MAG: hypothetical protein Q4B57_08705 [Eubacteriales bacterium]|nr:hypothetical protein [Eubacteriales bacterium]